MESSSQSHRAESKKEPVYVNTLEGTVTRWEKSLTPEHYQLYAENFTGANIVVLRSRNRHKASLLYVNNMMSMAILQTEVAWVGGECEAFIYIRREEYIEGKVAHTIHERMRESKSLPEAVTVTVPLGEEIEGISTDGRAVYFHQKGTLKKHLHHHPHELLILCRNKIIKACSTLNSDTPWILFDGNAWIKLEERHKRIPPHLKRVVKQYKGLAYHEILQRLFMAEFYPKTDPRFVESIDRPPLLCPLNAAEAQSLPLKSEAYLQILSHIFYFQIWFSLKKWDADKLFIKNLKDLIKFLKRISILEVATKELGYLKRLEHIITQSSSSVALAVEALHVEIQGEIAHLRSQSNVYSQPLLPILEYQLKIILYGYTEILKHSLHATPSEVRMVSRGEILKPPALTNKTENVAIPKSPVNHTTLFRPLKTGLTERKPQTPPAEKETIFLTYEYHV